MPPRRYRSIFVSDVHLGTPDCKASYLLDFLRRNPCEQLYLVGDIIDLEQLAIRSHWQPIHSAVLAELLDLARRGTRVIYIPGNHDAPMRGLAGRRIGEIEIQLEAIHVTADGRRFRVCHGDVFDVDGEGRTWLVWLGDHAYRQLCRLNRWYNALRQRTRRPYFPLSILAKSRVGKALTYIRRFETLAADAVRAQGLDGVICGHIHFGAIREIDGVLYINDGDWVEHCTGLVEHPSGELELVHWSDRQASLGRAAGDGIQPGLPQLDFGTVPTSLRDAA